MKLYQYLSISSSNRRSSGGIDGTSIGSSEVSALPGLIGIVTMTTMVTTTVARLDRRLNCGSVWWSGSLVAWFRDTVVAFLFVN